MANFRNFRLLPGSGEGKKETDRLDRFLIDLADPGLISSLQQDEQRRKRLLLAAGALIAGLVLGGGGMLLALHPWRTPTAMLAESSEEKARILIGQGQKLMMAKDFEKSWTDLRLATELAPNLVDAWDALSFSYFYGGQIDEAEKAARRCLRIDPEYRRAYHLLGDFSFYSGDWAQARKYWLKAGKRERALARLDLLENRYGDAVPQIRKLVRELPDDPYVRVMGEALRAGRITPEVRIQLQPTYLVSRNPDIQEGWRLYYDQRFEEASVAFSRAIGKEPSNGAALVGRGWAMLKLSSPRVAQSDFEQVLASSPSNYSALNGMAWSFEAQGMDEGAAKLWERVLALPHRPHLEIPESLKGLGRVYAERGDYARANYYLGQSLMLNPYDAETSGLLSTTIRKLSPASAPTLVPPS